MDTNRTLNVLLFIVAVIAVGVALKLMQPVLTLFLVALMLAYLIDPVLVVMDDHLKLPLWLAVPLTGVLSLAVLSGIGLIIVVNLVEFTRDFDDFIPDIDRTLQNATEFVASRFGVELPFDPLQELRGLLLSSFDKVAVAAQSVLRGVRSFLLVFFFALLFLSAKHRMTRNFADAFSHPESSMPAILGQIDRSLRRFIGVKTLISLSVGTATTLILLAFGVRFAVVWGLLTFLLNFIPSVGSLAFHRRRVAVLLRAVRRRPDPDRGDRVRRGGADPHRQHRGAQAARRRAEPVAAGRVPLPVLLGMAVGPGRRAAGGADDRGAAHRAGQHTGDRAVHPAHGGPAARVHLRWPA